MEIRVCGALASTENVKLPTDTRRLRCPGGHARDSARRLAPLLPSGFHACILLDVSVFFHGMHGSPPGCTVHFWEYSAGRGGCIRTGSVFLGQRDPSTDYLGWRTGFGAAISRVSRRAGPQNDADRAAFPIRGVADGDRDAEYSGFCTVQAGVRWDGKGCPRLFMHYASEIMQDNRAPCTGYPDWGRHAPLYGVGCPTGNSHEGYKTIETSKYRLNTVYRRKNTVRRS